MIFLNLGCGYPRPGAPWFNIDQLHSSLPNPKSAERINLAKERNYIDCDLSKGIPFNGEEVDGIFASHFLEHLTPQEAVAFLQECSRVLRPGGVLRVSVPDAARMMTYDMAGIRDYAGEYVPEDSTFTKYVLLFGEHKMITTEEVVVVLFHLASCFSKLERMEFQQSNMEGLASIDNRPSFSLFMEATK
jgi:predicted SAM-dependent methyltransferase